ncbi:amino acid adenylation domain-containing protein [Photorhabdus asymbiotica]|uniref:amino acid adenylation domain-containing protein n=1 Tax=Photorhabdus asymbiotica TaxID=291112 RepID=UPI003DA6FD33
MTVQSHFVSIVDQYPDQIAIADDNQRLTYRELDQLSNQVANFLEQTASASSHPVALFMDRSLSAIIVMLGILKAGRTYLPIDTSYPREQLEFILVDSQAACMISDAPLALNIPCYISQQVIEHVVEIDVDRRSEAPLNPAYIMYTSGSTGRPKGVIVGHEGIKRLVINANYISCTPGDIVGHCSSIGFDASTLEIWLPLLNGGTVYVIKKEYLLDFEQFARQIDFGQVKTMWLTVALFNTLYLQYPKLFLSLRRLIIGGDALNISIVRDFLHSPYCHLTQFLNGYGPTENTTFTTTFDIRQLRPEHSSVPIGKAISGTQLLIVDDNLNQVIDGDVGELLIGGTGIALGYTSQQETEKKFLQLDGQMFYRSGDLVQRLETGDLVFVGRRDNEVKIRGLRINLSQIELCLTQMDDVQVAYVRPDKQLGQEGLVAYVQLVTSHPEDVATVTTHIRAHLSRALPAYMIPNTIVIVDKVPLTRNGKVNVAALTEQYAISEPAIFAYSTPMEYEVGQIYQSVLRPNKMQVTVDHSFFELGGNSLQIYQTVNLIQRRLKVAVSVKEFIENNTIAGLAALLDRRIIDVEQDNPAMQPITTGMRIALSPAQRRLWFIESLEHPVSPNLLTFGYQIKGNLLPDVISHACHTIVEHNIALRCAISLYQDELCQQIVNPYANFDFIQLKTPDEWRSLFLDEAKRPFDLAKGDVIRFRLVEIRAHDYLFFIYANHIVVDGWSISLLIEQLSNAYHLHLNGNAGEASREERGDYWGVTRNLLNFRHSSVFAHARDFWVQYLDGCHTENLLPVTQVAMTHELERETFSCHNLVCDSFNVEQTRLFERFAATHNVTLFTYLLTLFSQSLAEFAAVEELLLAVPTANREGCSDVVGMFVNTLPIRISYDKNTDLATRLQSVSDNLKQCISHSSVYLDEIKQTLSMQKVDANIDVLQVGIALQNTGHDSVLMLPNCDSQRLELPVLASQFSLFLHCSYDQGELIFKYEFDSAHVQRSYVDTIASLMRRAILNTIESDQRGVKPAYPVAVSALRSPAPILGTLTQRFFNIVEQFSDCTAVLEPDCQMTYRQLCRQIQVVREVFIQHGIESGCRIGVQLTPSIQYIHSLFAILHHDCSFVPLDVSYPKERLDFILQDSGIKSVLLPTALVDGEEDVVPITSELSLKILGSSPIPISPDEACLLYTSGSTGVPKGVQISHQSLLRLCVEPNYLAVCPADRFLVASSVAFDASLFEIFVPLLNGASCGIVTKAHVLNYPVFEQILRDMAINTAWLTVSLFNDIYTTQPGILEQFDNLIIGGDALNISLVRSFISGRYNKLRQFINGYGPTECTTFSTYFNILNLSATDNSVSIGKAINHTTVYVMDDAENICQPGQIGEIYIGGVWLKPNYHNRDELNRHQFVINPYYHVDGVQILYKTGDMARYKPDFNIEYIGRKDKMVKVRGHRVELNGINAVICQHPQIKNAVVHVNESQGQKRICAYLVKSDKDADDVQVRAELNAYLTIKLEPYQCPSLFVFLDEIPLTVNGKVDYRRLKPLPTSVKLSATVPRTPEEELLFKTWVKILGHEEIGIFDNFFHLGGHSLLIPRIIAQLESNYGYSVTLSDFLANPTISTLAGKLGNKHDNGTYPAVQKSAQKLYVATESQLNLLFSHELAEYKALYNIPYARVFSPALEVDRVSCSIQALLELDRTLSAALVFDDDETLCLQPHQYTCAEMKIWQVKDLDSAQLLCTELAEYQFDLLAEPLVNFHYIDIEDQDTSVLFINIHHIIADGQSIDVIFKHIVEHYYQQTTEFPPSLDYCDYIQSMGSKCMSSQAIEFWQERLMGYHGVATLKPSKERTCLPVPLGYQSRFNLPITYVEQLKMIAMQSQASYFEVLCAIYQMSFQKAAAQADVVIGFPYSDRIEHGIVDRIGYFVEIVPLRCTEGSITQTYDSIKKTVQEIRASIKHRVSSIPALSQKLGMPRYDYYSPLIQNVFSFHRGNRDEKYGKTLELTSPYCRFDTVFTATLFDDELVLIIECSQDLYSSDMPLVLFNSFKGVLDDMISVNFYHGKHIAEGIVTAELGTKNELTI